MKRCEDYLWASLMCLFTIFTSTIMYTNNYVHEKCEKKMMVINQTVTLQANALFLSHRSPVRQSNLWRCIFVF